MLTYIFLYIVFIILSIVILTLYRSELKRMRYLSPTQIILFWAFTWVLAILHVAAALYFIYVTLKIVFA